MLAVSAFLAPLAVSAQTKVVVIPLAGDDIMPPPAAPLASESPASSDYTQVKSTTFSGTQIVTSVIDKKTGLEWQYKDGNTPRAWDDAVSYCSGLSLGSGDLTDWRLPEVFELQSIVKYGASSPAINTTEFASSVNDASYWSASSYASHSVSAWFVDFSDGSISADFKAKIPASNYVRCVRGGSNHYPLLMDNGDGTVTDLATGLMWQQTDDNTARALSDANTHCTSLSLAGKNDWRLPNIKELASIVDYRQPPGGSNPVIDARVFPGAIASVYWSASSYASDPTNTWSVTFSSGHVVRAPSTNTLYVRCVR